MAELGFNEAYRTDEFVVEIEGIESPGITKVSGLSEGEISEIEQPDGGANITHKISSGIIKYDDITLEKNLDGSQSDADFKSWFEEMFKLDGSGTGSALRRNGSVVKKQFGKEYLKALLSIFTAFPIHSYVRLNSDAIGRVVETPLASAAHHGNRAH